MTEITRRERRALLPCAFTALDILSRPDAERLARNDFDLRMHQRGFNSRDAVSAIRALERRQWIDTSGGVLSLTACGQHAARNGGLRRPPRKLGSHLSRMPPGLF
jgi:hypothetical protein